MIEGNDKLTTIGYTDIFLNCQYSHCILASWIEFSHEMVHTSTSPMILEPVLYIGLMLPGAGVNGAVMIML